VTDRPPPDPEKLLADWMEWEKGGMMPGRVISNLKTHGMRELLESLVTPAEGTVHPTAAVDGPGPTS
jgi:hypothetical protein